MAGDLDPAGAVCAQADPELWFPEKGESPAAAKALYHTCPLQTPCLDFALEHHPLAGVWGGTTEKTRSGLINRARAAA